MVSEFEDVSDVDMDYYDPEDDPTEDNVEGEEEATHDGENEPAEEAEAEQDTDEENAEEGEPADDDPVIDLDGEQVPLSQLKAERMRQQDYTRKTEEVARERETVQQARQFYSQETNRVQSLLQGTVKFLESVIPDEPPLSMLQNNPDGYHYQKELRAQALKELQSVMDKSKEVQQSTSQAQKFDQNQTVSQHVKGLERRFPHLKGDQQKLVKFVQDTRQVAVNEFGFSGQEVANLTDDRIIEALHYASLGKKAEHNRNNAKRRLQTPKKGQGRPNAGKAGTNNRTAMQRLSQTGSLKDALKIDFE